MKSQQHSPAEPRSIEDISVGYLIFFTLLWLLVTSSLYLVIPPVTTEAEYTVTVGQPVRTDGFEQVVPFERLSPAAQDVFITIYRHRDEGERHSIVVDVSWTDRHSSPYEQFQTIHYVQYRD